VLLLFVWQLFLQRLYWTCCLYKRPQWLQFSSLSTLQTSYTHSWVLRATRSIIHHHSTCQVIKIQVKAKRLSWCNRTWCSILLKWRLGLVTLGDWQHLGGLVDRGPSELTVVIVEARMRSWWPCTWFELHHARDGERRLLVSALILMTWVVTRPFVGVTTCFMGDCQIIDTTEKNSLASFTFKHLLYVSSYV
jgi:hypothetical protein